ncbi:sulfotransferase [Leptothoe sp. EHU-05/26/07-4]
MNMTKIKKRVFLVGCPRSGTTLLQSVISSHPKIASFPESKFFKFLTNPGSKRHFFKLAKPAVREKVSDFLRAIDREDLLHQFPCKPCFIKTYSTAFVNILDTLTLEQDKSIWLEKTPEHIQRINCIEENIRDAAFIHIVRDGKDVVSSLYEVSHKFPEFWGWPRTVDQCIQRWINDVEITNYNVHKLNHLLVRYENLVADPENVFERICSFLAIDFQASHLNNRGKSGDTIILDRESWKASIHNPIEESKDKKINRLFNDSQIEHITQKISSLDINTAGRKLKTSNNTDCDFR